MKKNSLTTVLLVLMFIIGLSLLLYPSLSDYWNSLHSTQVISNYTDVVAELDENQYEELYNQAVEYNQTLLKRMNSYILSDEQKVQYKQLLNVSQIGIMGYIEIPSIEISIPIYHGTDESVLQVAIGHLEWSSLPVGGQSTHCVLSGHRGLPSAKLFTNLDKLTEGDVFMLRVLEEILTYEVDQILIVEPNDTKALQIVEGEDYCTLVTCTPYGINSHRLLVRGHRIENIEEKHISVTADAVQIEPFLIAPIISIPILLVFFILLYPKKLERKRGDVDD